MNSIERMLKSSYKCLLEMLAFFPILLAIGINIEPHLQIVAYLISIFLLNQVGAFIRGTFNIRNRWLQLIIGIIVTMATIYICNLPILYGVILGIVGIISFFRGIIYMESDWDQIFPRPMWWMALGFYAVAFFLYSKVITIQEYLPYIIVGGFMQVIISLIILNSRQLADATLTRDSRPVVSSYIKRQNRILLLINLVVIAIIASFNRIKELTKAAARTIGIWILKIIDAIHSLMDTGSMENGPQQGMPDLSFGEEAIKRNPILDLIFDIIAIVLIAIGGILTIYLVYRGIKRLISIVSKWFKGLLKERDLYEEGYGYIDEKENLMDLKELRDRYTEKVRGWIEQILEREPKWKELKDNRERIRYIYRMTILRSLKMGYSYREYMTPAEVERDLQGWQGDEKGNILKEVVPIYNRARYGDHNVEDREIEAVYRLYRKS